MAADRERIDELLREGLDHYGVDDVDAAVRAWQRVLELDPDNTDARDYIEAAGADSGGGADGAEDAQAEGRDATLLEEALMLAAAGQLEDAYALLEGGLLGDDLDLPSLTVLELVRGRLLPSYRARFAKGGAPRLAVASSDVARFNLPPHAGFLVSLCDGRTDVGALSEAAGMDEFDTLRNLKGLVDAGLVSVGP